MHKRKANRLIDYDYSQNGFYFVTICAKNRKEYFWEISDGEIAKNYGFESQRISKIAELDEKYYYAQSRSRYYYYR